jgi:hypothetical protein
MEIGIVARLARGIGLAVALTGALAASPVGAQSDPSSITIHNRLCPTDITITDYFTDCHDNPQDSNLEFVIDGPVSDSGPTDDNGDITFSDLSAGTYQISGGVPGEFAKTFVYCSDNADQSNVLVSTTDPLVELDLPEGMDVTCDWYNTPEDLKGDDDGDDDGGPVKLPNTGVSETPSSPSNDLLLLIAAGGVLAAGGTGLGLRRR